MRGRLIYSFLAELARIDRGATRSQDPDGTGPLFNGYDDDFKEPVRMDLNQDGRGESVRKEYPSVRVPCQVEPRVFDALNMLPSGNSPRSDIDLVFHFKDLERLELVNPDNGEALIQPGDRLTAIYDKKGALVQEIRTPPGLYVTESRPIGFGLGLSCSRRSLLLVSFNQRNTGIRRM